MIKEKYFLVGMPGSGKSTIGRLLANKIELPFIDLDEVIVESEGQAISEIFKSKGEGHFRELERKCLINQVKLNGGFVLATGGGAPCFFDNMNLMNKGGTTIFINVSPEVLFNKFSKKGIKKRPLLTNLSRENLYLELRNKFEGRKKFYSQSKIRIVQEFTEISQLVNEVISAIQTLEK
jgi:shikimate kinase